MARSFVRSLLSSLFELLAACSGKSPLFFFELCDAVRAIKEEGREKSSILKHAALRFGKMPSAWSMTVLDRRILPPGLRSFL